MRSRWLARRALLATLAMVIWSPGCFVAGWWQATVAMSGNTLSYLYAVEWPVFAIFGVVVWWWLVHDDPDTVGARGLARLRAAAAATRHEPGSQAGVEPPSWIADGEAASGSTADGQASAGWTADGQAAPATWDGAGHAASAAWTPDGDTPVQPSNGAPGGAAGDHQSGEPATEEDEELRAYNEYLASLRNRPKTWARR